MVALKKCAFFLTFSLPAALHGGGRDVHHHLCPLLLLRGQVLQPLREVMVVEDGHPDFSSDQPALRGLAVSNLKSRLNKIIKICIFTATTRQNFIQNEVNPDFVLFSSNSGNYWNKQKSLDKLRIIIYYITWTNFVSLIQNHIR